MRSLIILLSFFYISPFIKAPAPAKLVNYHLPANEPDSDDKFPVPPDNVNRLFFVQRSPNTNTIIYELNNKNGRLDQDDPIHIYWLRYADKGQREELNYIQRKFAYGLTTKSIGNDQYDVRFVSYKKFPLTLMKTRDGKYHIFATFEQKQMILSRIFVKIEGGSFWLPNVVYIELKGTDPSTGREITEHFKP
jgi:hypothetical protein